jgi:hypothetical protein
MKNNLLFPLVCLFLLVFLAKNQKENACNSFAVAKGIIQTTLQSVVQDTLKPQEDIYQQKKQQDQAETLTPKENNKKGSLVTGAIVGYFAALMSLFRVGAGVVTDDKNNFFTILAFLFLLIAILCTQFAANVGHKKTLKHEK